MLDIIWPLIIAISVSVFLFIVLNLRRTASERLILQRLELLTRQPLSASNSTEMKTVFSPAIKPALLLTTKKPLDYLLSALIRSGQAVKVEKEIMASGLGERLTVRDYFSVKILSAILISLASSTFFINTGVYLTLILPAAAYIGFILPDSILSRMVEERQAFIRRLLPDAIDILVVGVESGLGFERALRLYTERFSGALSEEFSKTLAEIDLGQTRRQAMADLAARNQLRELNLFVSAILQAEKLGTPLASILAIQSEEARSRHRQWAQEMSAKAPVKILFPLAGLILPALFGVLIGPVVIKMMAGG